MSAYRVDRSELLSVIESLQRLETQIEAALESADREVDRLHASWSGSAAEEHRAAHTRWRRGASDMHTALSSLRTIAIGAHANYDAAVTANVSMWSRCH